MELKVITFISNWLLWQLVPSSGAFQSYSGKSLVMKIRCSFHLYGSELTAGNEFKRPNIATKDALIALITKEIPKDLGALSQEPWIKSKYTEKYTLVILIIKYVYF